MGLDYSRNRIGDFFVLGETYKLNRPLNDSFKKRPYYILDDLEMDKFPELNGENDLIILKNVRLANKNYKRYKRKSNSINK